MIATEIQSQFSINENPDIVITREVKGDRNQVSVFILDHAGLAIRRRNRKIKFELCSETVVML